MKTLVPLLVAVFVLAPAAAAQAVPPEPFGHSCTPQNGTLFCPTANDAQRVPTFDGVPLDVDVTLPPNGDGPFPAIVLMHGWGGGKASFQPTSPEGGGGGNYHFNDVYFARKGYAVITASARGFGRSCGALDVARGPRRRTRMGPSSRPALRDSRHPAPARAPGGPGPRPAAGDRGGRHLLRRHPEHEPRSPA